MKVLRSSLFRALCAIVVGLLLIIKPDSTVTGITIAIGVLFLLSGFISCITYYNARLHAGENVVVDADGKVVSGGSPSFPIVGLGSLILGFILALMPGAFVTSLMYVLGAIVILGAINQFMVLINAHKTYHIHYAYWICPTLLLLAGLVIIINPMAIAAAPLVIIGICLLIYGVSECINSLKIHQEKKKTGTENADKEYTEYTEVDSSEK
jgi:uncharacterized membrane protein HdeD (DUF308 family)